MKLVQAVWDRHAVGLARIIWCRACHPVQRGCAFLAPQTFQLDARTAVEAWLSNTCKDLPAASAGHLRDLTAGMR